MIDINWCDVKPAQYPQEDYKELVAGGYIMKIIDAQDNPEYNYLELKMDIVEGEFKDYGAKIEERTNGDWGYKRMRCYYHTDKCREAFRRMLDLLESENKNFSVKNFANDEKKLIGLVIGIVLDEDDYNDYFNLKPNFFKVTTLDKIREGKFRAKYLPKFRKEELKCIAEQRKADKQANNSPATSTSGTVIPF